MLWQMQWFNNEKEQNKKENMLKKKRKGKVLRF